MSISLQRWPPLVLLLLSPSVLFAQTASQDYARYASMLNQERADQLQRDQQSQYADMGRSRPSTSSPGGSGSSYTSSSGGGSSQVAGMLGSTLDNMVSRHNAAAAQRQARNEAAKQRAADQWAETQRQQDEIIAGYERAHPLIQRDLEAASHGDIKAMSEAGLMYAKGIGVAQNRERGLDLLTAAGKAGDAQAAELLAMYYGDGEPGFVAKDPTKALEWQLVGARNGDVPSMVHACSSYIDGTGTPRNYPEADKWCTAAIARGHAVAANNLAYMYSGNVPDLKPDRAKAITYYKQAIAMGEPHAADGLYNLYRGSDGGAPDRDAQFAFAMERASAGDHFYETEVGIAYYLAQGVKKDDTKAITWLTKAADSGSPRAMNELSMLVRDGEGTPKDTARADQLQRQAAVHGWGPALFTLGIHRMNGTGVQQDEIEGERLLRLAADNGDADAPCALSQMYAGGLGVERDENEAQRWLKVGLERGGEVCRDISKKSTT